MKRRRTATKIGSITVNVDAESLRRALADVEAAEAAGFTNCAANMTVLIVDRRMFDGILEGQNELREEVKASARYWLEKRAAAAQTQPAPAPPNPSRSGPHSAHPR
jgi:hypothetical protein